MVNDPTIEEIVLHIGMHKTGTSSIQESLEEFDDGDIRYARLGLNNHSVSAKTVFEPNPYDYRIHALLGRSRSEIDELKNEYQSQLHHEMSLTRGKLILSGEDISLLTPKAVSNLKKFLSPHCRKITVIAYIREPFSFIQSYIQEQIKHGITTIDAATPDYRCRFGKFIDAFGFNNIYFFEYNKSNFPDRSVVAHFCGHVGISRAHLVAQKSANTAHSHEATQLLYLFMRERTNEPASSSALNARNRLINELRKIPGKKFRLDEDLIKRHLDQNDLDWMRKTSGLALKPANDGSPASKSTVIDEADLSTVSTHTLKNLRALVKKRRLPCKKSDTAVDLLNTLYDYFEKKENSGSQKQRKIKRVFTRVRR